MIDPNLKMQLERATFDLEKTDDVDGVLLVATNGNILHHNLRADVDMNLFGPMSQVISSSSGRLLNSSGQGEMKRVLVESSGGKALFLSLDNVHLIILMQTSANLGMVMVTAKRASEKIVELTAELEVMAVEPIQVEEELTSEAEETLEAEVEELGDATKAKELELVPGKQVAEEKTAEETAKAEAVEAEGSLKEVSTPTIEEVEEVSNSAAAGTKALKDVAKASGEITTSNGEITPTKISEGVAEEKTIETGEHLELSEVTESSEVEKLEEEAVPTEPVIPTVKPPISFPDLPTDVQVPDDPEKRSDLMLDIYQAIFLAMSLGAAKIMGVAPARGLTKQFLPFDKCERLLAGVDVKSNATIDFGQIKKNAANITPEEREKIFLADFSGIISVITENYGRVMGYDAFRGMVRPEFEAITKSYGEAIEKLGIKDKIHPELANLLQ